MKRKNIILAFMSIMTMLITVQSCKKDDAATPTVFVAAVPENPTPAVDAVVALAGTTYTIKWAGTASAWDIYLGTTSKPSLVKAGVIGNSYTFTTAVGGEFFWYVKTVDANKVTSKSTLWNFYINSAPTVPSLTAPAANAIKVSVVGALSWASTDAEGDALSYDVYLGTTATPGVVATDLTSATFSPTMVANTLYYWKVIAKDSHGATASSAVGSFTTGAEPIMTYTGNYLADEPAEAYSYDVTFTKASSTTVKTVNYWNSGWTATFTIDVTKNSFTMSSYTFSANWTGVESGVISPATGKMTGYYSLWYKGVLQEEGIHTYTKK